MNWLAAAISKEKDHSTIIIQIGKFAPHFLLVHDPNEILTKPCRMREPIPPDLGKPLALAPHAKPMR
jgi:hypothetical protein